MTIRLRGPVKLRVGCYFSNNRKRDLDNEIVIDNHIVYDDKQIDDLRLVRHCDPSASRVEITVTRARQDLMRLGLDPVKSEVADAN